MIRIICRGALLLVVTALVLPAPHLAARSGPEGTKSIFVSVLDEAGNPVKDLKAEEFMLREDGGDREIVGIKPAADPLQVVFLVDTTDAASELTRDIRASVMAFIHQLHGVRPDAAISLTEFGQAAITAIPFSTSDADLEKALNRLVSKPDANSVLMEALIQANGDLAKRPSPRRAIVSLNVEPSNEQNEAPNRVQEGFRKSTAQLWSVSLQRHTISTKMGTRDRSTTNLGDVGSAASSANVNSRRDQLLQQWAKYTGGERQIIVGQSAAEPLLKQYADALTYQYEVMYKRPGGSPKAVQIGTTRTGVKLHASGYPPQ